MLGFLAHHFIAIIIIAVVNMIIGFLWYHPNAFGKAWIEAHGFNMSELKATPKDYALAFGVAFVLSWVIGGLFDHFGIDGIFGGWYAIFWVWLGFIAAPQFSGVIWARKSIKAYGIDVGYFFAALMVMAFLWGIVL